MHIRLLLCSALTLCATLLFVGCDSEDAVVPTEEQLVAADVANNVILCIYADLQQKSMALQSAVDALIASPSQATLDAARQAWRDARVPWEMSEAFLHGPVSDKQIDPNVDSWPLDLNQFDSLLNASFPITPTAVATFPEGAKGFHAIEYIIFGPKDNPTQPGQITGRLADYLHASASDVVTQLTSLYDSWKPDGENYARHYTKLGTDESKFSSDKDAIDEIMQGLIGIANEVGVEKITPPFANQNASEEESLFSSNSNADFRSNILGLKAVYLGTCGSTTGKGITNLVAPKNAALDASVRQKIDATVAAIDNMLPSYSDAIFNNKPAVQSAIDASARLTRVLEDSVLVLIVAP